MYATTSHYGMNLDDADAMVFPPKDGGPARGSLRISGTNIGGTSAELRRLAIILDELAMDVDAAELDARTPDLALTADHVL